MTDLRPAPVRHRAAIRLLLAAAAAILAGTVLAHPLGNFTINHFARIEAGAARLRLRYIVDHAEIPTLQEMQAADADGDGTLSEAEKSAYLERAVAQYLGGLRLTVDGAPVSLRVVAKSLSMPPGDGGLPTLRVECDLTGDVPLTGAMTRRFRFEDTNHQGRLGWHELMVTSTAGVTLFNSSAYGNAVTDELKAYPQDSLMAPLNERAAEWSLTRGELPEGARALLTRDGRPAARSRDRLAELIAVPELTPAVALGGLLIAFALGGLHALSPGHGKTIVGAYLAGSRGTARHAVFLGVTVTITHTAGVFALGLVTLFASQYIVPERLFPILSLVSGGIVLLIGLSLFVRRLRAALGLAAHEHAHPHSHAHASHDHAHNDLALHNHADAASDSTARQAHGGREHSHLPPGADGEPVTWRSLLALGISGGLLPCPSALVVLLSAIALHRVGYGLLLVVTFSLGLASVLTGVGLAFVYAGRLMQGRAGSGRLVRVLPALSALVITGVGAAICVEALPQVGVSLTALLTRPAEIASPLSVASILGLGLILGLKHALEADHLAAVATIVSERKSWLSSSLVGGLWGVGHTISLLIAGAAVILLHLQISERLALWLEFGVALMLVGLGAQALYKLTRGGRLHLHVHHHGGHTHVHPHLHHGSLESDPRTHHGFRLGARPLIVGMVHGLAGSAALMLLVLSTIPSPVIGFVYIAVFGLGSIGGMMLMSSLVGLPVHLTAARFTRAHLAVRGLAGLFSLGFGLFMVYEIGFVARLLL
jgi:nickel/cobalt exporter